jgi:hypothetical protein
MGEPNTSSMNLSRSLKEVHAIFVPKAREPWLKRPLDVVLSSLMLILCQGGIAARNDKRSA